MATCYDCTKYAADDAVTLCPKHAATDEMIDALRRVVAMVDEEEPSLSDELAMDAARSVIAKAKEDR